MTHEGKAFWAKMMRYKRASLADQGDTKFYDFLGSKECVYSKRRKEKTKSIDK